MAEKHSSRPWYEEAFRADYLERYSHRSDSAATAELPFIFSVLSLTEGSRILDLCCGAGRHSRALAAAGFGVIGLDLSRDLLQAALRTQRQRSARTQGEILYLRGDMRRLPIRSASLDGVVNLFTSFGYFSAEDENAQVIREAARVLKPGAPFLLDFFNLKSTLAQLVPKSRHRQHGGVVEERRRYDPKTKRIVKETRILEDRKMRKLIESVRAYSPRELKSLFKKAGLRISGVYGDLNGADFAENSSPRCVIVGRK